MILLESIFKFLGASRLDIELLRLRQSIKKNKNHIAYMEATDCVDCVWGSQYTEAVNKLKRQEQWEKILLNRRNRRQEAK